MSLLFAMAPDNNGHPHEFLHGANVLNCWRVEDEERTRENDENNNKIAKNFRCSNMFVKKR